MATNTYASAMNLANQVNPVSYDEIKNQITSSSTGYTPQYQGTSAVSDITADYLKNLEPVYQASANKINQNYDNSQNQGLQFMANKGLSRSGANMNQFQSNENNRNGALNESYANLTQQAVNNATNVANLGLSEQSLINSQNNTAVNQLSDLLSQYSNAQQQAQTNQYTEAGLTGLLNGQQTLAGQGYADSISQSQQDQALAQLNALLSYNLGVGGVTDSLPQPTDFTYGDAMTKLLQQIYGV